jgi:exonuclease III
LSTGGIKKYAKVEGVTVKKPDILLLSDCRVGKNKGTLEQVFMLSLNGEYELYLNSKYEARGTGLAVRKGKGIKVQYMDTLPDTEDILLCDIQVEGKNFVVGSIYGPNANNVGFFEQLKTKLTQIGKNFVIGGDFNTILDQRLGDENIDREGREIYPIREIRTSLTGK